MSSPLANDFHVHPFHEQLANVGVSQPVMPTLHSPDLFKHFWTD